MAVRWPPGAATPFKLFAPVPPSQLLESLFPKSFSKSQNGLSLDGMGQVPCPQAITVTLCSLNGVCHVPIPQQITVTQRDKTHFWSQGEGLVRLELHELRMEEEWVLKEI